MVKLYRTYFKKSKEIATYFFLATTIDLTQAAAIQPYFWLKFILASNLVGAWISNFWTLFTLAALFSVTIHVLTCIVFIEYRIRDFIKKVKTNR